MEKTTNNIEKNFVKIERLNYKAPREFLIKTQIERKISYIPMTFEHLRAIDALGRPEYGTHFDDRLFALKRILQEAPSGSWIGVLESPNLEERTLYASICWNEKLIIGYMISYPCQLKTLPLDKEYKSHLSKEQKCEWIYLIHDSVVHKSFRNLGIHKIFHKLSLEFAFSFDKQIITKLYGVALTTKFRKPDKKYRFQDVCKAQWHGEEAMIVCRDLTLEYPSFFS